MTNTLNIWYQGRRKRLLGIEHLLVETVFQLPITQNTEYITQGAVPGNTGFLQCTALNNTFTSALS